MLTIEFAPPQTFACECCGHTNTKLIRYVCNEDGAYAVYLARFAEGHPELGVISLVSLGPWGGDGADPAERVAFGVRFWAKEGKPQVQVVSVAETPWDGEDFFGLPLSRDQALTHSMLPEVFRLTDRIALEDEPVRVFLQV